MAVFFQNHPGMKDILMPILKTMQARFDFLLPTGSHGKITALGANVHCSPSDPELFYHPKRARCQRGHHADL